MVEIPLTQGKVALVDDADAPRLLKHKWNAAYDKAHGTWYAQRGEWRNGKVLTVRMHREILEALDGDDVDHEDHNGLNNRRSNLRVSTRQQNGANRRKLKPASSSFKGVSWHKASKNWQAYIRVSGKLLSLGRHTSEKAAAEAYNKSAARHFGAFALLNTF